MIGTSIIFISDGCFCIRVIAYRKLKRPNPNMTIMTLTMNKNTTLQYNPLKSPIRPLAENH